MTEQQFSYRKIIKTMSLFGGFQEAYKEWNNLSFPITEKIHREVLSLPISPIVSINELKQIITKLNDFHEIF